MRPPHLPDLTILELFDLFFSLRNKYNNTSVCGNSMVPVIILMDVCAFVCLCVCVCVSGGLGVCVSVCL